MLILASSSPRRQELLRLITPEFEVLPSDADETLPAGTPPVEAAKMLARLKAEAVAKLKPSGVVIGADTIVNLGGEILGKPKNRAEAADMLRRLSGRSHTVTTGVCVIAPSADIVFSSSTEVRFVEISEREISDYVATGEPMDKAGAYGIQGKAALFVAGISGDYCNVVGLPVSELYAALKSHNLL